MLHQKPAKFKTASPAASSPGIPATSGDPRLPTPVDITERNARLVRLWWEGLSFTAIGRVTGISRSTAASVIVRDGLRDAQRADIMRALRQATPSPALPDPPPAAPPVEIVTPPAAPEPIAVAPSRRPPLFEGSVVATAFEALTLRSCRYPMGDPGTPGFRFCCERAGEGRSYCLDHLALCCPPRARTLVPTSRTGALHGRA